MFFSENLTETNRNILCEVLKALFNITIKFSIFGSSSEKLISDFSKLVLQLQSLLCSYNSEKYDDLLTDISHLFVNIPKESVDFLCSEVKSEQCGSSAIEEETKKLGRQLIFQVINARNFYFI